MGTPGENDLMASPSSYLKPDQKNFILRIPTSLRNVDAECQAQVTRLYLESDD